MGAASSPENCFRFDERVLSAPVNADGALTAAESVVGKY